MGEVRRYAVAAARRTPGESGESCENPHSDAVCGGGEHRRTVANAVMARARGYLATDAEPASEYPVAALGPLADACASLAEGGQVDPAMSGQCLLGAAALLAQGVADVQTLAGRKPLSLYALTLADSGDGKSTAEDVALRPVMERQREDSQLYRRRLAQRDALPKSEQCDETLRAPYRLLRDGTIEGIRAGFSTGLPSQGLFTSEGAVLLGGYGMSADHRAKTAGGLNGLWDDGHISVGRALAGRVELYGQRFSAHVLVQPDAARDAVTDPLLSDIGLWPRFLLAWPRPAPPRRARPFRPEQSPGIRQFWSRCNELLDEPLGEDCGGNFLLEPNDDAVRLASRYFERMEHAAKDRDGSLRGLKPFAARATEQAFRIAGVLAVMDRADVIDADAMRRGLALASYGVEGWRALFADREDAEGRQHALTLLDWLLRQPSMAARETAILRMGPRCTRSRSRRDTALALLEHAGVIHRRGKDVWEVVP